MSQLFHKLFVCCYKISSAVHEVVFIYLLFFYQGDEFSEPFFPEQEVVVHYVYLLLLYSRDFCDYILHVSCEVFPLSDLVAEAEAAVIGASVRCLDEGAGVVEHVVVAVAVTAYSLPVRVTEIISERLIFDMLYGAFYLVSAVATKDSGKGLIKSVYAVFPVNEIYVFIFKIISDDLRMDSSDRREYIGVKSLCPCCQILYGADMGYVSCERHEVRLFKL